MNTPTRNSRMELGKVYFWTDTIKDWRRLLKPDKYKQLIVEQLQWLTQRDFVTLYSYVIMPNHLHLIWRMNRKNGKEMPHASFNKWTSHHFLKDLRQHHPRVLPYFVEETTERKHRFWQRDALAVLMDYPAKFEQKLRYIHYNPLQERWSLVTRPEEYRWSSAGFYEGREDAFGIVTHYKDAINGWSGE